jgi:nicotinate-nucleotide adenylyltransferase
MRSIALLGGVFDPPHPGHFKMGKYICETLGVNELWFLFSYNPQKNLSGYASEEDRLEMGRILALQYPDMPFVMSNIQSQMGTHMTYDVLSELKNRFPEDNFIWVMGTDNLSPIKPDGSDNNSYFEKWENYEKIIENFSIAVVERPGYRDASRQSPVALKYKFLQVANPKELATADKGWCFLDNPQTDISSSGLLERLRNGDTSLDPEFQGVEDFILERGLYGVSAPTNDADLDM